jgi:hypothetical protein
MPLTVGPDPQNPGRLIWIDSETGQPATQASGEPFAPAPTPPVAPERKKVGLADLIKQQGEGWAATGNAVPKLDESGAPIPNVYTVVLVGPNGAQRIATVFSPEGAGSTPDTDLPNATFDVIGTQDTIKPPTQTAEETNARIAQAQAQTATAQTENQAAQLRLQQLQKDQQEAEANEKAGKGYFNNAELAKWEADQQRLGVDRGQLELNRIIASNNNKNAEVQNQIAAQNAATAAFNAAREQNAVEARIKYEEGQLGLDQAKFARDNADKDIANQVAKDKLALDQLQQKQSNLIQQQQNLLRGQELQQRTTSEAAALEQRKAEAAQQAQSTAQTSAAQAAASVFGTERQAQTAAGTLGGNVLGNRATAANNLINNVLSGAAGFSQGSAGRYGTLGGGLQAMPAGFSGQALVGGALGVTGQMFGGQPTLDAAARMVRGAAPGAEMTPYGQAAAGVLSQMFDKYHQLAGEPHPEVLRTGQVGTGGRITTPITNPNAMTTTLNAETLSKAAAPAMATPQTFTAPQTQPVPQQTQQGATPTIVMNF